MILSSSTPCLLFSSFYTYFILSGNRNSSGCVCVVFINPDWWAQFCVGVMYNKKFIVRSLSLFCEGKGLRKRAQHLANISPTCWPTLLVPFALPSPTSRQHLANIVLSPYNLTSNIEKWRQYNIVTSKKQCWANVGELLANNIKSV